jgi:hypothetical protein
MQNPYHPPAAAGYSGGAGNEGAISQRTASIMARTKGWVRFIGIAFIIFGVLMLIPAIFGFASGIPYAMGGGLAYLIMALLSCIIPGIKLNAYANRIGDVLRYGRASDLESALNEHRGFWKFVGILQLIGLGFMLFGFIVSLASR